MEWWQAVILGVVEGITEYLPVSSTGHLIIASALLGLDEPSVKANVDAFNIVIQGGAILAVLGLYRERVAQMIRGLLGRDPAGLSLAVKLFVAFLPAAVLGLLLDDLIERHLFEPGPVIAALALGGVWMIALGRGHRRKEGLREDDPDELANLPLRTALFIGLFQVVAMWPGTSRSMMTIAGGTLLGLSPKRAAEFSFLLGLPTLGGACVYKLAKNLYEADRNGERLAAGETLPPGASPLNLFEALGWTPVLIGMAVATVSAALAVRWLVSFLTKHGLAAFGWYRLALAAGLTALVMTGVVEFG
jgi:undecaprenyl-diphosphatase